GKFSTTADIGPAGGELKISQPIDYRLTIPPGALATTQTLTLTVFADGGSPFGGPGIVKLEPADVRFAKPVDLEIMTATDVSKAYTHGLAADADGGDVHLVPLTFDEDDYLHVSLDRVNVAGFTTTTIDRYLTHPPTREDDLAQQRIAGADGLYKLGA